MANASKPVKYINTIPGAPKAVGPYSPSTLASGTFLFLAGQIPLDPETGLLVEGSVSVQTERVMKNIQAVLVHSDLTFSNVVKTTIFLQDMGDFKSVNEVYAQYMKEALPARSTIQVAALPLGAKVEIEMIAVVS
jgi:2-iminobutanoate/2-iminopropanoate deaminase